MNRTLINILLIEDDPADARLIKEALSGADVARFDVVHVDRLSNATDHLLAGEADVILFDLSLPRGRGFAAFLELRRQANGFPIVVMAGQSDRELAIKAVQAGAQNYLVKGAVDDSLMTRVILHAMERHRILAEKDEKVKELTESEIRFRTIIEQSADGVLIVDREGVIRFVNPAAQALLNAPERDLRGELFGFPLVGGGSTEIELYRRDGHKVFAEMRAVEIKWEGDPVYLATLRDTTAHREVLDELQKAREVERHLAYYDVLTGLPNRQLFYDRLQQVLTRAKRYGHRAAVIFLDLDKFKQINDSFGHDAGDLLLKSVANRLKKCIRESDSVARLGGDEFTAVVDRISRVEDVAKVVKKVLIALSRPFIVGEHELKVRTSIGVSLYPTDGPDPDTLIKHADFAMYRAKNSKSNSFEFYSRSLGSSSSERFQLEKDLQKAIEHEDLVLYYQPQVDICTAKITGVEALVRWQHPKLGLVGPAKFIPFAEETGLIVPLGEWVLRTGCEQNKNWHNLGIDNLRIAINLSARQFRVTRVSETLSAIIRDTGLSPSSIVFEITESSAMLDVDYTIATLNTLKNIGIQISMDDFGTGYASLSYLKRFPLDILKIDRSFVRGLHDDHDDWAIVSAIIAMSHKLKLRVLAEGVEHADQLAYLRALKCDEFQGFYSSKAIPADACTRLLRS